MRGYQAQPTQHPSKHLKTLSHPAIWIAVLTQSEIQTKHAERRTETITKRTAEFKKGTPSARELNRAMHADHLSKSRVFRNLML